MKVSILLPVFNEEKYLHQAIESILNQSYTNWELIIIDNCSTDETLSISNRYKDKDSRINVFSIPEKGMVKAYNYGFTKCSGDIICYLSGDDILPRSSLEIRALPIINNPSKSIFTTCLLKTFSKEKKFNGNTYPKNFNKPNYSAGSLMFKKEIADKIFPIPIELPNEDVWTSLHLKAFCENIHIPKVLHNYRIHSNNTYGYNMKFQEKKTKFIRRMSAYNIFLKKYIKIDFDNREYFEQYNDFVVYLKKSKFPFFLLLTKNKLSFSEKLKFLMYSSKGLFWLRYKFPAIVN